MNQTEFTYWLQGMLEYTNVDNLSERDAKQKLKGIQEHLALVFNKVTPKVEADVTPKVPKLNPSEAFEKMVKDAKDASDKAEAERLRKQFEFRPRYKAPENFPPDVQFWLESKHTRPDMSTAGFYRGNDMSPRLMC